MTSRTSNSHLCPHCKGVTRKPKGQRKVTLEQAIKNHEASCPGLYRINPSTKGKS